MYLLYVTKSNFITMDRLLSYCTLRQHHQAIFLLRLSRLVNMTKHVGLTMACTILTAGCIINHFEFSSVQRLLLKQFNLRSM
jgi:hypothetical protein